MFFNLFILPKFILYTKEEFFVNKFWFNAKVDLNDWAVDFQSC